ncbi:hypothetical protein AAVH_33932 [Aphelenchoides avenae]|nr:hypothetical protein AAVH_33932 [Aphelenchus avenae]
MARIQPYLLYFRSDGHRFVPSHLRYVSQLIIAQFFFLTDRKHPTFRAQRKAWNTWALATWKLETLQASKRLYGMNVTSFHADFTDLDFALLGFHLIPPTKLHQRVNALLGGGAPGGPATTVYAANDFGKPIEPALMDLRNMF